MHWDDGNEMSQVLFFNYWFWMVELVFIAMDHICHLHSYPSLILPFGRRQDRLLSLFCRESQTNPSPHAYWFWLELVKFQSFFIPFYIQKNSPVLWRMTGKPKLIGIDFASFFFVPSDYHRYHLHFNTVLAYCAFRVLSHMFISYASLPIIVQFIAEESWVHRSQMTQLKGRMAR